jgi:N6-adenosine-specific RNA methylase IME4
MPMNDLMVPGFRLERMALVCDGQPTFAEWQQAGQVLRQAEAAVHWWIGDWLNIGERKYGDKYAKEMEANGFEYQTLANDKWVSSRIEFSRRRENLSYAHHCEVASLPPAAQDELLAQAEAEAWSSRELRKAARQAASAETRQRNPLPAGKYRVLYADPPWKYNDERQGYGAATDHYSTLAVDELCALPVGDLAGDEAVLFLWATAPLLPDCLRVVEAWGFAYKTFFVWDKVKHNYGHYNSVRAELLLLCTRGSCTPDSAKLFDSVVQVERSERHSEKPEAFRQLIDQLYGQGPRIELFARKRVNGWDSWGAEAPPGPQPASVHPDAADAV